MKFFLGLVIVFGFIILLFIISAIQAPSYDKKVEHSQVTIELSYSNGVVLTKDFVVQSKNVGTFDIGRSGGGIFSDGYSTLTVFKNYNSWSGVTKTLETDVITFKILKVRKL